MIDIDAEVLKATTAESLARIHPLLQFFAFGHLPPHLQAVSEPFCRLALHVARSPIRNAEHTTALRKLLEAKDCAVRAQIYIDPFAAIAPDAAAANSPASDETALSEALSTSADNVGSAPLEHEQLAGSPASGDVLSSPVTEVTSDDVKEYAGHPEMLKDEPVNTALQKAAPEYVAKLDALTSTEEAAPKDADSLPVVAAEDLPAASPLLAEPRRLTAHIVNPANDKLSVLALDEFGSGGASHSYVIDGFNTASNPSAVTPHGKPITMRSTKLLFQNGPISEVGVNGITHEALLAILIDRLRGFQEGPFANKYNGYALMHLGQAQSFLHQRTRERMDRGVEGTHQK